MDMQRTIGTVIVDGRTLRIHQDMIDMSDADATWHQQGPFLPGLKSATLDGEAIALHDLRAFLTSAGRLDLIAQLKIPDDRSE
jgi:hypothetical protein